MADLVCVVLTGAPLSLTAKPNTSLDASGGSVFLNFRDEAKVALIRAPASQPLDCSLGNYNTFS
jgi:hypothetical protein